jgi:predicted RNA-binding protein YlqC (UPF0109 family)
MKATLQYLVERIVDHPSDVVIDETTDENRTILTIHAHEEDMGKIIGKSGRIIRAIRDFMKIIATKKNLYVEVGLSEEGDRPQSS